jgi:hypothetical protein
MRGVPFGGTLKLPARNRHSLRAPVLTATAPPSTSELIKKAQEAGFGDWYPVPEDTVEMLPLNRVGAESEKQLVPNYPEPDTKEYLVDERCLILFLIPIR